ncbi:MAG: AtpZ/AtpI family protein [Chloroflexi bacterium]|nr:AtpZ/AtpI family protein [Chloroflexota bacterium]
MNAARQGHDAELDTLLIDAEELRDGRRSLREFLVNLDWGLSRARLVGGDYAPQIADMVDDVLEDLLAEVTELPAGKGQVLVEVMLLAARQGNRPETVRVAHERLVASGLRRRAVPSPRPRTAYQLAAAPRPRARPASARHASTSVTSSEGVLAGMRVLGMGWAVVLSLVLGIVGGVWVDGQLGTSPLATLGGLAFGAYTAFRTARSMIEETRRKP